MPPSGECPEHGRLTAISNAAESGPTPRVVAPNGWTIGHPLASGGTALVYEVQRASAPPAVMKLGRWGDDEVRARFLLEAEVLRTVGPPATPALIADGIIDERPYLIMERVSGETLAAWMARTGERGGVGEVVALLTRIAGALAAIHAASFIHRDLKPENIMIGPKGTRLIDFGLVKPMRSRAANITQVGTILGTPHYLAPEQIKTGAPIDVRADIYAFGVVAYEMLTGRPPFVGERRAIEYHHQVVRPTPVSELRSVPEAVEEIVMACLAKQPENRPANAEVLRTSLSAALNSIGTLRGVGPAEKRDSRPLGANSEVALAWIEHADPVIVARAVAEVQGIVVRSRGAALLAAFVEHHNAVPLDVALGVCRALAGERRRCAVHLTTALIRRTPQGKATVYGPDVDHAEHWIPSVPFSGVMLTREAANALSGGATPAPEVPGFFRPNQRDRTDATDARVDPPLVGRDGLIRSLIGAATSTHGVLIGVTGMSGSGKTRVLRVIAERLQALASEVIQVTGQRRLLGDRPDDERLIVALGGGDDLADALASAAARDAVLVIDDLTWFSPGAQRLVLDPHLRMRRVVASQEPLFEVPLNASDRVLVELPPLSYADASVLLRALLQPARLLPDALIERLAVRGTGNPGLLIALALDIKRRGAIRRQQGGGDWYVAVDELDTLIAPPGPSWFANRLLEELPAELAPVARLCAALGPRFNAEEAKAATELSNIVERLGVLVRERVLLERNGWYAFEDASLQEAIYDHVLDERELVHRRVLLHWIARDDRNVIGRLARLAHHAAGAREHAIAGACWTALARNAVSTGDLAQADTILARAVLALGNVLPPELRSALYSLREATNQGE